MDGDDDGAPIIAPPTPAHIYTRAVPPRTLATSRAERSLLKKLQRQQTVGSAPCYDSENASAPLLDRSESLPVDDFGLSDKLKSLRQSAASSAASSPQQQQQQSSTQYPLSQQAQSTPTSKLHHSVRHSLRAMRAFKSLDAGSSGYPVADDPDLIQSVDDVQPPDYADLHQYPLQRQNRQQQQQSHQRSAASSSPQREGPGPRRRWPSLRSRLGKISGGSLRRQKQQQQQQQQQQQHQSSLQSLQNQPLPQSQSQPQQQPNGCHDSANDINKCETRSQATEALLELGDPLPDDQKQSTSSYLKEQFFAFFQPSDNKLAMKLFGNKNALMKEKRRQQQTGKWIIHPCSNFRFYWDLLMLILLITNLVVLPVAISFFNDDLSPHWIIFNCVSDTIFLSDIAVNFRTGVITNDFADEIILDPKLIAQHYVKSWFFLDLVSSIPMDYIFLALNQRNNVSQLVHAGRALRILRLAKLLSLLRLLRLSRLVRYVSQWEELLQVATKCLGIVKLILIMLLLGHWNACFQFLVPFLNDFPDDSWVTREGLKLLNVASVFIRVVNLVCLMLLLAHWNGCLQFLVASIQDFPKDCWVRKLNIQDAHWFRQYTWALFKAMSHMLSIGYGQHPPTSISEAWITIVSMMTGSSCYALFVGHAAALIQSFDTSKRLYREKFKQVEEYMAYRKLPRALRQRIANYYEHRYQGKMFNENDILSELSECLREQIINYNCRALVAAVPFFTYADQDFVSEVVTKLKYEVFQPGDLIIKEGTIGTKMYFIQEGIVDIITKDGEVATSLSDGSYFGEICLLTNARRVASVRAETYCNLYSLERENFLSVLDNYPLMRRTMESVAAERLSKIGQNPQLVSSRADLKEDLNLVKEIVDQAATRSGGETTDDEGGSPDDEDTKKSAGCTLSPPGEASGERRMSVVRLGLQKLGIAKRRLSEFHQHFHQHSQQQQHQAQLQLQSQLSQQESEHPAEASTSASAGGGGCGSGSGSCIASPQRPEPPLIRIEVSDKESVV